MDSDKIRLPDFLIADLYKSSLVDPDAFSGSKKILADNELPAEAEAASSINKINYFGGNLKNVIIVVKEPNKVHLNKEDLTFLTNILKACQLTTADIAIINIAGQEVTFTAIKEQLGAPQIVLFDVEPSLIKLPFVIPPFQVQNFAGTSIMLAPALSALNKPGIEGRLLKTKLWNGLKQLFNI